MCALRPANRGETTKILLFAMNASRLVIGTLVTFVCYILTRQRIRSIQKIIHLPQDLRTEKLLAYPVVFLIVYSPAVIYHLLRVLDDQDEWFIPFAVRMIVTHS